MVVDLSHHNDVADFDAVKAPGIAGVIHKATEGVSFTDKLYGGRRFRPPAGDTAQLAERVALAVYQRRTRNVPGIVGSGIDINSYEGDAVTDIGGSELR